MKTIEVIETDRFKISYITQKSPARDDENEDSMLIMENNKSLVLAVADGLGGHTDGQFASKLAMTHLEKELKAKNTPAKKINHYRERILRAFDKTNQKLLEKRPTPSTTLSVVEVFDDKFRAYFSGDSEVFQIGSGGKLKFKTQPHNPVGLGEESGLITNKEAFESDEKHLITNFLGMNEARIELGPISQMDPRDVILLCSDGLTHNLRAQEICDIVRSKSSEAMILELWELAKKRMNLEKEIFKEDDLTLITVFLK